MDLLLRMVQKLNDILPRMSPLNPQYLTKKQTVFRKISEFVESLKESVTNLLNKDFNFSLVANLGIVNLA